MSSTTIFSCYNKLDERDSFAIQVLGAAALCVIYQIGYESGSLGKTTWVRNYVEVYKICVDPTLRIW
jgi:hypothetical protein